MKTYTDEEINVLVELARSIGVNSAIKELGYPSRMTADKWIRKAGVAVPSSAMHRLAQLENQIMSLEDKMYGANLIYKHHIKAFSQENMSDISLAKLTASYKTLIETLKIIQDKTDSAAETVKQDDDSFKRLLAEFNEKTTPIEPSIEIKHADA